MAAVSKNMAKGCSKELCLPEMPATGCAAGSWQDIAHKLKVCGHPARLKLLQLIGREDYPCVGELWSCLGQSQPVVSQHLAVLKANGIVRSEVQGNRRVYTISDPLVRQFMDLINREI